MSFYRTLAAFAFLILFTVPLTAQVDGRMLRYPDVSATEISFVYAGDIWVVPKTGGVAEHLSSPPGEETFPRFSPDGSRIAFSGNYDGNTDIYVIPAGGGRITRVTHHPMADRMLDWYPDGEHLLYASAMHSGRQRFNQLYKVAAGGGFPERLPVPYGEFGTISPDGKFLAYMPKSRDFRTWKRYRGGWAPDIWLFDLEKGTSRNITDNPANDAHPMWHDRTLYFLSDRGPQQRHNIWAYDVNSGETRQVTHFADFDIAFPAIGPDDIVFQAGGTLYRLDLQTEQLSEVKVEIVTDMASIKPRRERVSKLIADAFISPSGRRVAFEARGEIFTVPAKEGVVRNLTHSSGSAERFPTWSPDGRRIAYWSDRTGEYQLTLRNADGSGVERTLTSFDKGFRYRPQFSPDSRRIAFVDQDFNIYLLDVESGKVTRIDQGPWNSSGALAGFTVSWSRDSRWLAYSRSHGNDNSAIYIYDTKDGKLHQATTGYFNDFRPVFDPDGKYLYFFSNRNLKPVYGDVDNSWVYPNSTNIAAVTLRFDVKSPLAPRNDEEPVDSSAAESRTDGKKKQAKDSESTEPAPLAIEFDGFERRLTVLPPAAGNYGALAAVSGKVVYQRNPRNGSDLTQRPILYFDLKERKEQTIVSDADGFQIAAGGKKMLVAHNGAFSIVDIQPKQKLEEKLATSDLEMTVDPRAEWKQIFTDAWRFERDFFYDPNMHGVDWDEMRRQYGALVDEAVTRWDVNYILGELIAELNASHTYRGGGDVETPKRETVGLLGVDWSRENGAYRIRKIIRGAPWDTEARSPLDEPGLDVKEGDYVLAVNGIPLDPSRDPWSAFEGLGGKTVTLTVNDKPAADGAREVLVKTMTSETRLRHLAWIESNRARVDEATGGRAGYIYVPNTGIQGQNELVRQFQAQFNKDALVIDERFNSGGQIPDRFIELLNRPLLSRWAVRTGPDWKWPPVSHQGPKVMLINGWSGSGGDAFPYYFKKAGLGPLVGMRTWGGLIGISGAPALIDGGNVTVPTFRMYSTDGEWFAEGHGVDPDIEVPEDPAQLAKGRDTQLEAAIAEIMRQLEENPPAKAKRPPYENRTAKGKKKKAAT